MAAVAATPQGVSHTQPKAIARARVLELFPQPRVARTIKSREGGLRGPGGGCVVVASSAERRDIVQKNTNKTSSEDNLQSAFSLLLHTLSSGASAAINSTIRSGKETRHLAQSASTGAIRSLVSELLSEWAGMDIVISGKVSVLRDGLLLSEIRVGDCMTVRSCFVRAQLEPLLAVLKSWRAARPGRQSPPILLQAVSVRGVVCTQTHALGLMRAYRMFRQAAGVVSIATLSLTGIKCQFAYHDAASGAPQLSCALEGSPREGCSEDDTLSPPRSVDIKRMEFKGLNSQMTLAQMSAAISLYREQTTQTEKGVKLVELPQIQPPDVLALIPEHSSLTLDPDRQAAAPVSLAMLRQDMVPPEGSSASSNPQLEKFRKKSLQMFKIARSNGVNSIIPKDWSEWIPPVVTKTVDKTLQTSAASNVAPILEGNFTHMIVQGATMLNSAVDLGSAGVDTFRAAAGTEAIIDAGLVLALIAQGLPKWFISRKGGALLVKMIETGIAAELLKQGNLIKTMVDRRLLERMLELNLLDNVLARAKLTKKIISQGVLKDMLDQGVIEAMIHPDNEDVLFQLLDGEMLEVMVESNILLALKFASAEK